MKNANQIRHLLKEIKTASGVRQCDIYYYLKADQALALLPCETCEDLKVVPHGNWTNKPCPDCQKKPSNINPAETIAEYPESQPEKPLDFQEILDCWSVHPIDDEDCVSCPQMYECRDFRRAS